MRTFCITSLGCKVNRCESLQIAQMLMQQGLTQVQSACDADLAVVHTCCVTHIASSKSRQLLRKQLNCGSHCKVIATGCLPDAGEQELHGIESDITLISKKADLKEALLKIINASNTDCGNSVQNAFAHSSISKTGNGYKIKDKNDLSCTKSKKISNTGLITDNLDMFSGQSRAFLKIQDGCDGFCSYCIIPKIRTEIYSVPAEQVIAQAQNFIAAGHTEIVLTGIFLGAYGQDTVKRRHWDEAKKNEFVELIDQIAALEGLKRLRLSSLEPGDITDELIALFAKHKTMAPHLHLPLQSGSQKILKKMNRQYTVEQFIESTERLKAVLDRPALTADIIVGFPGETEDDFLESVNISRLVGFAQIHVFSFSKRKGTAAEKMPAQLPPHIIKERSDALHRLDQELQQSFRMSFAGQRISVIVENERKQTGHSERYFEVQLKGTALKKRDFTYAILEDDGFHARPCM